jgi:phosphate transport system substrate-binding protein
MIMRRVNLSVVRVLTIAVAMSIAAICPLKISAEEIKVSGSTTFAPLVSSLGESFMKQNPTIKISFSNASASDSINAIMNNEADIGCSARLLRVAESDKAELKGMRLICRTISLDCILPIVHPSNNVMSLGLTQVGSIFKGKITNWKEFDRGTDTGIRVISRENGSAMYEFFDEKVMHGDPSAPGTEVIRSNPDIVSIVSQDPSAIGYTSYSYISSKVKVVPLMGSETMAVPTEKHPLSRKLLMCTNDKASKAAERFVAFITGPEGKSVIQKAGYLLEQ